MAIISIDLTTNGLIDTIEQRRLRVDIRLCRHRWQVLKLICWYAVLAPSGSEQITLLSTTAQVRMCTCSETFCCSMVATVSAVLPRRLLQSRLTTRSR